jgi:colanic acid biosynthesis glycosyl transferase WcaI
MISRRSGSQEPARGPVGSGTRSLDQTLVVDYGAHQFSADFACCVAKTYARPASYAFPHPTPTPNSSAVVLEVGTATERRIVLSRPFQRYGWRRIMSELELAYRTFRLVRKMRPTTIYASCMPVLPQLACFVAARSVHATFNFWLQDIVSVGGKDAFAGSKSVLALLTGMTGHVERMLLRRSDRVIAISAGFVNWLVGIGVEPQRILLQPNWSDPKRISPTDRKDAHHVFGPGGRVFLYAGTVGLKHDVRLLQGLGIALAGEGARLVVISEGEGAEALSLSGDVVVLPFQESSQHATMLASADVLVVSLRTKAGEFSVPSKVNAYLCAGRPILAALPDTNLAAQILAEVGCPVTSPDDRDSFYQQARSMAQAESGQLDAVGWRCRNFALEHFDVERITNSLIGTEPTERVDADSRRRSGPLSVVR